MQCIALYAASREKAWSKTFLQVCEPSCGEGASPSAPVKYATGTTSYMYSSTDFRRVYSPHINSRVPQIPYKISMPEMFYDMHHYQPHDLRSWICETSFDQLKSSDKNPSSLPQPYPKLYSVHQRQTSAAVLMEKHYQEYNVTLQSRLASQELDVHG